MPRDSWGMIDAPLIQKKTANGKVGLPPSSTSPYFPFFSLLIDPNPDTVYDITMYDL